MKQLLLCMVLKLLKKVSKLQKQLLFKGGIGKNIPEKKISKDSISKGINIIDLIFQNNLFKFKSEARRILKNKGIKINDKVIDDDKKVVGINEFEGKDYIKLSVGKKNH